MLSSSAEEIQKTEWVKINQIKIGRRGRSLNIEWVEELARSINVLGLLQPIVVTSDFQLVAGRHRVEAYKMLGRTHIPAVVRGYDEMEARLATIDENLVRNNLTALEEGEQLAERQSIYLALHPEMRRGVAGARARHGSANDVLSFAEDAAAKTGQSTRSVQRHIRIVDRLSEEVKDAIRNTPLANSYADMERLSDYTSDLQEDIIATVRAGKAETVAEAFNLIRKADILPRDPCAKAKGAIKQTIRHLDRLGKEVLDGGLTPENKQDIKESVETLRGACDLTLLLLVAADFLELEEAA